MRAPIVRRYSITRFPNYIAVCMLFLLFVSGTTLSKAKKPNAKAPAPSSKLSNAVVVQLTKLHQPACVIIATIQTNETAFDTSGAAISGLRSQGVDPVVMREMFESQMRSGQPLDRITPCGDEGTPHFAADNADSGPVGGFRSLPDGRQNPQPPAPRAPEEDSGQTNVPQAPKTPVNPSTISAVNEARNVSLDFNGRHERQPDPGCPATGACITLNWATKTTNRDNVIRRTGDYQLHVINVNDIFYQYSIQGETKGVSADNDFKVLQDAATAASNFLGQQSKDANKAAFEASQPCPLNDMVQTANTRMQPLQTALDNYIPKKGDKTLPSVPLDQAIKQWDAVVRQFTDFREPVLQLQSALREMRGPGSCSDQEIAAAASLITGKVEPLVEAFKRVDDRVWGRHVVDSSPLYCERTAGCSFSVKESSKDDSSVLAAGSPFVIDFKPFYAQLSVDGGFLLTRLPALSYSSRTAPDPADPTNKTQNVLAVEGASTVRPAMVALLTYHFPWHFLDGINQGLGLSAGPVFDISNGKADTSKFGLFAGGTAHLWNRFFLSAGIHVGEFADFPQGFTRPGQVIPTGTGTPTPVKRYTSRFAFGITYKMKDLSVSSDTAQATTKTADSGNSGNGKK